VSIHETVIEGKSIPVWYHMVQGSMCIGVACSIVGLAVITNSIEGKNLKMTVTVHRACACILGISSLELFVGLYVFITYIEETDFFSDQQYSNCELYFYGSFYAGCISVICSLIAALIVYNDEEMSRVSKSKTETLDEDITGYYNKGYQFETDQLYDLEIWRASQNWYMNDNAQRIQQRIATNGSNLL
jgi:hypothetical protein